MRAAWIGVRRHFADVLFKLSILRLKVLIFRLMLSNFRLKLSNFHLRVIVCCMERGYYL